MTGSVLGRLIWKEYRLLRGFWVGMLLLCLLGQLAVLWEFWDARSFEQVRYLSLVAVGVTAFYVLGCGATAFAGERDMGTDVLQRVLPVTPGRLLLGKLLFAAVSALVLGVVAWSIATLLVSLRWQQVTGAYADVALLGGVKAIELLVWGVFFSLRSARPLRAVVLAALATAFVAYPLSWLLSDVPEQSRGIFYFPSFLGDTATIIPRLIIAILVLVGDIRLVARWFREPDAARDADVGQSAKVSRSRRLVERLTPFPQSQRLLWQLLVRTRWILAGIAGTYLAVVLILSSFPDGFEGAFALVGITGWIFGIFVFAEDQSRRQFRFFAEHGISPRHVWWTRQLFWGLLLFFGLLIGSAVALSQVRHERDFWLVLGAAWFVAFMTYASAQLCSQWIRSTLVAVPIAFSLGLASYAWAGFMFTGNVNLLWSVAPIPLILLFATWATANDWIKERRSRAAIARKAMLLAVPALLICSFVIYDRWTQIPVMHPQFDMPQPTAEQIREGKETEQLYAEAWDKLKSVPDLKADWGSYRTSQPSLDDLYSQRLSSEVRSWLQQHQGLVETAMMLSHRPRAAPDETWPLEYSDEQASVEWAARVLRNVAVESARMQQEDGQLDQALDQYLAALRICWQLQQWILAEGMSPATSRELSAENHILMYLLVWANQPAQNAQRIRRALDELDRIWSDSPPLERMWVINQYRRQMAVLDEENDADIENPRWYTIMRWWWRLCPWERVRARRLADAAATRSLEVIDGTCRGIQLGVVPTLDTAMINQFYAWEVSTPQCWGINKLATLQFHILRDAQVRRGTQLILALEGWRCDHGQLPESLDELVPEWFKRMPLDSVAAKPFDYYPHGSQIPVREVGYAGIYAMDIVLPPSTPYIVAPHPSAGSYVMNLALRPNLLYVVTQSNRSFVLAIPDRRE